MNTDKVYIIRWFGPFKSVEEVNTFEKEHKNTVCVLYMLQGMKKNAKLYDSYYCGQAKRGVYNRLTNKGHHIEEFSRLSAIWIGNISNIEPTPTDINYVENILTAEMADKFQKKFMLNKINMNFPHFNIYVINVWHKTDTERIKKYSSNSLASEIPDLIGHEYYTEPTPYHRLFGAPKIQWLDIKIEG